MLREKEKLLAEKAAAGDIQAFERLLSENEKFVYNLALRLLGNEQDAQDAAQEVFVKMFTSLGSFRGESKLSVWLYRITSNICTDMLRRRKGETISLYGENDEGEAAEIPLADERFSPQTVLERKELQRAVREGLERLPEDYRSILLLREMDGRSYDEIAEMLSLDMGTVKSRIFRARKKLCKILSEDGNISGNIPSDNQKGGVQA